MAYPMTAADIDRLFDQFPEVIEQLAAADPNNGFPIEQVTKAIIGNAELVRYLAAIGRGVPLSEVKVGALLNIVAALGCLAATSNSPDVLNLVQRAADRLTPPASKPAAVTQLLFLAVSNDQ